MKQNFLFETENQSTVFMGYTEGWLYHSHLRFEVLFDINGEIDVEIEGKTAVLHEGDIFIANPFEKHSYTLRQKDTKGFFIMFPNNFTPQLTGILSNRVFAQSIITQSAAFNELIPLIRHIENHYMERHYPLKDYLMLQEDCYISGILSAIVAILEYHIGMRPFSSAKSGELLFATLKYLHAHFTESLNTRQIAAEFHYSERHFAKIFYDATKMTLPDYLSEIRLNNAISLMADGEMLIDAASKSGFNSLATFHRVFKKKYQLSPRAYIDSIEGENIKLKK